MLLLATVGLAGNVSAADAELIAKGRDLFQTKICFTCHEVTGGPPALAGVAMKAPKFEGNFWGKERTVTLGFGGKEARPFLTKPTSLSPFANPSTRC